MEIQNHINVMSMQGILSRLSLNSVTNELCDKDLSDLILENQGNFHLEFSEMLNGNLYSDLILTGRGLAMGRALTRLVEASIGIKDIEVCLEQRTAETEN